ncbi:hypothetical protein HHK36_015549 [Tetracentron sinense]|uniref:Uncharacterized protein n=1 Tax=Tetracentron sinense TaxID=13715 RepID=A0A835DCX8_TETSI|nr:hypothetical protein HHK36_015549 [Tetracentron sinense]
MEFDSGFKEDLAFQPTFCSENDLKPELGDGFSFEACSSKEMFQDFHNFDQFPVDGSSLNSKFGVPTPCFDPFEVFGNGCSTDFNIFESKPLAEDGGNGAMQGLRGFLNYPQRPLVEAMEQDPRHPPLNFQEFELANFVIPDEISCITADNGYYREVGLNKKSMTMRRTGKGHKKSNLVKGQWTIEEDR